MGWQPSFRYRTGSCATQLSWTVCDIACLKSTSKCKPGINAITWSQSVCFLQISRIFIRSTCSRQREGKSSATLHGQSVLCNNPALASTVLMCNQLSFDQCVWVQAANFFRTSTDDYLNELLRKSENRALEAEGQTRHYSQRVRTLEWQKFQDKQSDNGLQQKI